MWDIELILYDLCKFNEQITNIDQEKSKDNLFKTKDYPFFVYAFFLCACCPPVIKLHNSKYQYVLLPQLHSSVLRSRFLFVLTKQIKCRN